MDESGIKRPIGVSILAGLHIIVSTIGAVIILLFIPRLHNMPEFNQVTALLGILPIIIFIAIVFILTLAFASGIGMWMGKKWGWFLGSFYYAYFIITNISALFTISSLFETFGNEGPHGPAYYYVKHSTRLIVQVLIYLYLFRANVLAYFGLGGLKKWKPVLVQFGICLLIAVFISFVTRYGAVSDEEESQSLSADMQMNALEKSDANACKILIAKIKAQPEAASIVVKSGTAEEFVADMSKPQEPNPVVSLEDFFEGNRWLGSIGCNLNNHP